MPARKPLLRVVALLVIGATLTLPLPARADETTVGDCLYPSLHDRFGFSVEHGEGLGLYAWDVSALNANVYLDWGAYPNSPHPNGMDYLPMVHINTLKPNWEPYGYSPSGQGLINAIEGNPGALWLLGNEVDYRRDYDYATPEEYAEKYHQIYTIIKSVDPTARVAMNGMATVSPLRLAWLDRVWNAYRSRYGVDMPVDVWNVHTYVVNEMVYEWGPDLPTGFENAVGFTTGQWQQAALPNASGGTVHASRTRGARAYFAFAGVEATLMLHTGPDAGIANIYRDKVRVESLDLYAPEPGVITRTYSNLPASPDPQLLDRHHLRVDVDWWNNPASSDYFVRVDAVSARSTASLPGGRLEDNSPLRANIVVSVDEYDNLDNLLNQIRMMRGWMAAHGQRNKPLINTEFGILIGEEQGFTYQRVREYMLGAFDLLTNSPQAFDSQIGMPDDGNRMMQQWVWFILALDYFNGSRIHTGLMDPVSGALRPLGNDYGAYVANLRSNYRDLKSVLLQPTPRWPLFSGQASAVEIQGRVRNLGTLAVGPFRIRLSDNNGALQSWDVPGLSAIHGGNDSVDVSLLWTPVIASERQLTLVADSDGHVAEPCDSNNALQSPVSPPPYTDLALRNTHATPAAPTAATTTIRLATEVINLGGRGASDNQIVVKFWDGAPGAGGVLLHTRTLLRGQVQQVALVEYDWTGFSPGEHQVTVEVLAASGESALENNRQTVTVAIPAGNQFVYVPAIGIGVSRQPASAWADAPIRSDYGFPTGPEEAPASGND